jgi:hypothetical protein
LYDGAAEQALGGGHAQQALHGMAARGLARHCHRVRVTAECGDVVAYPLQGRELVGKAEVAPGDPRRAQVAEHAEPVVGRDDDYVAVPGEPVAAVPLP